MRDRQRRPIRIDVDRRHVQLQVRVGLQQVEARDAAYLHAEPRSEGQHYPRRVFAALQRMHGSLEVQLGVPIRTGTDLERKPQLAAALPQVVLRSRDDAARHAVRPFEGQPLAADQGHPLVRIAAEVEVRPLTPPQVGHAHCRQQPAVERLGGEGDRHPQDRAGYAVVSQRLPERPAAAPARDARLPERQTERPDPQRVPRPGHPRRAELRPVRPPVRGQEVEDTVLARVAAGLERRPGDRRLGRQRGTQPAEAAFGAQPGEVRQQPFVHELLGQLRILPVETQYDHTPDPTRGRHTSAPNPQYGQTQRPGRQCEHPQRHRPEQDEQRGDEREARPRPHIGERRRRSAQNRTGRQWNRRRQ